MSFEEKRRANLSDEKARRARKHVQVVLTVDEWKRLRREADRRGLPIGAIAASMIRGCLTEDGDSAP